MGVLCQSLPIPIKIICDVPQWFRGSFLRFWGGSIRFYGVLLFWNYFVMKVVLIFMYIIGSFGNHAKEPIQS